MSQLYRLQSGIRTQFRVISALMMRDILSRYGHENLGFFWVIGEPMLLTFGVMLLWSLMHMTHGGDVGVVPFALTGYTFITVWRHIVSRSQRLMRMNTSLKYHNQVKLLDVLLASALVETLGVFAAFTISLIPLTLLGACPLASDPLLIVAGFAFAGWFSFSFGLIIAGFSEWSELTHHLTGPIMYLTLPLTGTFFMVDWLPDRIQQFVLWSPLVNCIEMIRGGLFSNEVHAHWNVGYLFVCCCLTMSIGLFLVAKVASRIEM